MLRISKLSLLIFLLLIFPLHGLSAYSSTSPITSPINGEGNGPTPNLIATEVVLDMVVNPLGPASDELRKLVQQQGGVMVEDIEEREGKSKFRFTIRIDSASTLSLVSAVLGLGQLDNRRITLQEVSKELADLESLQIRLQTTLQRYDQILTRATTIHDMLAIEKERCRIEGEIAQGRASQHQLHDRVSRSFVYVNLSSVTKWEETVKW